jgi:hypothetical protein
MRAALRSELATGPVVQQLAQFFHGVADVGAQHVLAEELVEHLAHGLFRKATPPEWPGQCHE